MRIGRHRRPDGTAADLISHSLPTQLALGTAGPAGTPQPSSERDVEPAMSIGYSRGGFYQDVVFTTVCFMSCK